MFWFGLIVNSIILLISIVLNSFTLIIALLSVIICAFVNFTFIFILWISVNPNQQSK